jgi:hypothetical protein
VRLQPYSLDETVKVLKTRADACKALNFWTTGPRGTIKMLVDGSGNLKMTKVARLNERRVDVLY